MLQFTRTREKWAPDWESRLLPTEIEAAVFSTWSEIHGSEIKASTWPSKESWIDFFSFLTVGLKMCQNVRSPTVYLAHISGDKTAQLLKSDRCHKWSYQMIFHARARFCSECFRSSLLNMRCHSSVNCHIVLWNVPLLIQKSSVQLSTPSPDGGGEVHFSLLPVLGGPVTVNPIYPRVIPQNPACLSSLFRHFLLFRKELGPLFLSIRILDQTRRGREAITFPDYLYLIHNAS